MELLREILVFQVIVNMEFSVLEKIIILEYNKINLYLITKKLE